MLGPRCRSCWYVSRTASEIVTVLDQIATQRLYTERIVVGYSQGAHVAWWLATSGRVDRVVAMSGALPASFGDHGPHRIRHSVLTLLAEGGASLYALQAFARHSLMATTMTYYIHLDKLRKAREAVDMLAGISPPPTQAPVVPMRPTPPVRGNRLALAGK